MKHNNIEYRAYRFGRFVYVILCVDDRTSRQILLRADVEGEVRLLEGDDWESGRLLLYECEWKKVPPGLRARARMVSQMMLWGRGTAGGAK